MPYANDSSTTQVYAVVPKAVIAELNKRASSLGMSRSKYLGVLIEFSLESPSNRVGEVLARFVMDVRGKLGLFSKRGKAPGIEALSE